MFKKIEKQYERVYEKTDFSECKMIEESLWVSFSSYFRCKEKNEKERDLASFFYRNCIYLAASYKTLRLGMIDPALNNMRTVFETIIWQYSYLIDEGSYQTFKEISNLEREKIANNWSNSKEHKLSNLRRKNNFQKTIKKIYSKELYEKLFINQYFVLSQKSHVSIFGANFNTPTMEGAATIDKNPEEIRKHLRLILYLISENLLCFMNCFSKESLLVEVNRINKELPPAISLAPNNFGLPYEMSFKVV